MGHSRESAWEYGGYDGFAADAGLDQRRAFLRRAYAHVFGAILAFVGLEGIVLGLVSESMKTRIAGFMFSSWFLVLGGFIVVSLIAHKWASRSTAPAMQYLGLGLYVIAQVVIFLPLLIFASSPQFRGSPDVIPTAGFLTLLIFGGLTAVVFLTRKDFSFLGNGIWVLSFAAFGLITVSIFWEVHLGTWFVIGMIVLMSGFILYHTANILHHYRTTQHVAAALALLASVAMLFWYVLQFVIASDD